jgi:hypothetical protein
MIHITINITKKLLFTFSAKPFFNNFTLIDVGYGRFIDYNLHITICNITVRLAYENVKQREHLKKIYESIRNIDDSEEEGWYEKE